METTSGPEQNKTPAPPEAAAAAPRPPRKTGLMGDLKAQMEAQATALKPFLPSEELVGGAIPYIQGMEDEGVWNAAAQACGTERVHYCYTVEDKRCWYLAVPSAALASNPDSWCPLAAALPGNSEYWDKQTVYIYEQDGAAGALRWDQETGRMQVYLGAARTLLPRIQSMEANFVTINPEVAKPIRWKCMSLHQERLSRMLMRGLFVSGIGVTVFALLIWAGAYTLANAITPNLEKARQVTTQATDQLMIDAANALQTNTDKHMARIIELLNMTASFGGVLTRYEVRADGSVEWEALIPSAVQPGQLQAVAQGMENGRVRVKGTQ